MSGVRDHRTGSATFRSAVDGRPVDVRASALVIAGFTGRDQDAVAEHLSELAAAGVPVPDETPAFYDVPVGLLTTAARVVVGGPHTSGEVEPVLLPLAEGGWVVAVGSDHTDRDLERTDIAASKRSCRKVTSRDVLPLEAVEAAWSRGRLRSWVDGDLYQDAPLEVLTPPSRLLETYFEHDRAAGNETAMFCGTVPMIHGEFEFGARFRAELELGDGLSITSSYEVEHRKEPT